LPFSIVAFQRAVCHKRRRTYEFAPLSLPDAMTTQSDIKMDEAIPFGMFSIEILDTVPGFLGRVGERLKPPGLEK
jgi:hypothetical protein